MYTKIKNLYMKNKNFIIFILFIFAIPLSMVAQKKPTKTQGIITNLDTLIMRTNLIDSTVGVIRLNGDFVRFEKTSPQSFQLQEMFRDMLTTDSLCYRKQRITLQYDMFFYDAEAWRKYQRINASLEPDIRAIDAEIDRLQKLKTEKIREKGKTN